MIFPRPFTNQIPNFRGHFYNPLANHDHLDKESADQKETRKFMQLLTKYMIEESDYLFLKSISRDVETLSTGLEIVTTRLMTIYTVRGNDFLNVPGKIEMERYFSSNMSITQIEKSTLELLRCANRIQQIAPIYHKEEIVKDVIKQKTFENIVNILRYTIRIDILLELQVFLANILKFYTPNANNITLIKAYCELLSKVDWVGAAKALPEEVNCLEFRGKDEFLKMLNFEKKAMKKIKAIPVDDLAKFGAREKPLGIDFSKASILQNPLQPHTVHVANLILIYNFLSKETFQLVDLVNLGAISTILDVRLSTASSAETQGAKNIRLEALKSFFQNTQLLAEAGVKLKKEVVAASGIIAVAHMSAKNGKHAKKASRKSGKSEENELSMLVEMIRHDISEIKTTKATKGSKKAKQPLSTTNEYLAYYLVSKLHTVIGMLQYNQASVQSGEAKKIISELVSELLELVESKFYVESLQEFIGELLSVLTFFFYLNYLVKFDWLATLTKTFAAILNQTQQNGKENGKTVYLCNAKTKENIASFMILLSKMIRKLKDDSFAVEERNSWWKNRGSELLQSISDAVYGKMIAGTSLAQLIELIALLSKLHTPQVATYVPDSKLVALIKVVFEAVDAGTFAKIITHSDYLQPLRALLQIYINNDTAIELARRIVDVYRDMNYSRIRPLSKASDFLCVMPKILSYILIILKDPIKQEEFLLSYFKLSQDFYNSVKKQLEEKFNEAKEIAKSGSKVVFNNPLFYRCQIAIFLPLMLQKEYQREHNNRFPKTAKVIIQYFETLTIQIPLLNQFKSLCNYLTTTSVRDASYLIRDYASDISNLIKRLGTEVAENKSLAQAFSPKEKEWFAKNLFSWFEIITDLQYYYCLEDDHIDIQIHYPHYFLGIVDTIVGFKDILEKPMKDNDLVLRVFRKFEPILIKITPTSNRDITLNETWVNCIRWIHEFAVSLFDEQPLKLAADKLNANPHIVKILSDSLKLPTNERANGEMIDEEQEKATKAKNAELVENFLKDINIEPFNFIFEHIKRYLEEDSHRQVISLNFFLNFLRTISNKYPERKVIFLIFSNYIAGYFLRLKEAFTQEGKAHIWFKSGITVKMLILMNFTSHLKFKSHKLMEDFKIADILIDMVVSLIENVVEEYENSSGLEIPLSIHSSLIDLLCVAREAILSDEVRKSIQEQVYVPFINAKYRIVRSIIRLIKKSEFHNVYFLKEFYNIIIHTIHSFLKSNRKTYIEHLVVKDIFDKESHHMLGDNKNNSYKNLADLVAARTAERLLQQRQQQQQVPSNAILIVEEQKEEEKRAEVVNGEEKMVIEEEDNKSQSSPEGASTRNNRAKPAGENESDLQEFLKMLAPEVQKEVIGVLEEQVMSHQTAAEENNAERPNNIEIEAQGNTTTSTNHSTQPNGQTSGLPNDFLKNLPKDQVAAVLNRMCQTGVLERYTAIGMDLNKFLEEMDAEEREEVLLNSSDALVKVLNQNLRKQFEKAKNKKYEKNEEPFLLSLLAEPLFNDAKFLEALLYIIFYTGDSLIKSKYSLTVVKVFLKSEAIYKRFREIALCLLADSSSFFDLLFMSRPYQERSQSILNRSSIEEFTLAESTILESFFSKFDEEMCEFLVADVPNFVHTKDLVHNSPLIKQIIQKVSNSKEESSVLRRWMVRVKHRTPLYLKVMEQAIIKTITFVGDLTGMLSKLGHNPVLKAKLKKELEFCFLSLFNIALSSDSVQVHFIFQGAFIAIQDKEAMLLAEGVINQLMYDLIHQLASSIKEFPILPHQTSMFQQEYVYLLSVVRTFQDVVDYLFYLIDYSTRKGKRSLVQSSEQKHKAVVENFLQLDDLHFILNLIKDNPHYFDVLPDLVNVPFQLYFMKNITIGDRQVETLKRLTTNKSGYQHDEFEIKDDEGDDLTPNADQQDSDSMNIESMSKIREPSRSVEKISKLLLELIQKYQNHPEFVRIFVMRIQNHPKTRDIIKSALNFENRRAYLRSQIQKLKSTGELRLYLHRDNTLRDSFGVLKQMAPENLKRTIRITFIGEEAIDEGGVFREWIEKLSREIIDPQYGLFVETQTPGIYQPNPNSQIQENHLDYFEFIGKIISKALLEGVAMNCYFPNSFYKSLLGEVAIFNDFREYDPQLFENLGWILKNPVEGLELNFTYEMMYLGKREQIELVPNGSNVPVTEENKQEYVNLICEHKMIKSIQLQMDAILKGFYSLIPKEELTIFNSTELELLISGLPDYDVDDLRKNTMYVGYTEHSTVIIWFWDILRNFDQASRANFLHLISGSSKPPIDGFQSKRLTISRQANSESLPTAHTCAFQLNLPDYDSRDKLYRKLKIAIAFCEGFGMR